MQIVQIKPECDIELTFDDFWALYPRRVAKKEARHAWAKIDAKHYPTILTALYEWARIWNDRGEPQYTPHPATWLNGERWEDDFPPGHKPYTATQQRQEEKQEIGERKAMPPHVLEAIRRIRK